jgi:RNase P subunit RPR2
MGMYDSIIVTCPNCGQEHEFQSKSGDCLLSVYNLDNCPNNVLSNVNRHSPVKCDCGVFLEIDIENRKVIIINNEK